MNNPIKALMLAILVFSTIPLYPQESAVYVRKQIKTQKEYRNACLKTAIGFAVATFGAAAVIILCDYDSQKATKLIESSAKNNDPIIFSKNISRLEINAMLSGISYSLMGVFNVCLLISGDQYSSHCAAIKKLKATLKDLVAQHIDNCNPLNVSISIN